MEEPLIYKAAIESLMGLGYDSTPDERITGYVDGLLGACARDIWTNIPTPIFYSIPAATPEDERTERLSIMTQFFLANLNVYCKARSISTANFGEILDASNELSRKLVGVVTTALSHGRDVERILCVFCNVNADKFGLFRYLNAKDLVAIRQQFERTYRTITATLENRHMDDETKVELLVRINVIEGIDTALGQPVGLVYSQRGTEHRNAHFDLTQLVDALQRYVDGYDNWERTYNLDAMKAAWMEVGIAQRDMPVHVVNEYCRLDRLFDPRPEFNEGALPRSLRFFNFETDQEQSFFPLVIADSSGLGINFAVWCRGNWW